MCMQQFTCNNSRQCWETSDQRMHPLDLLHWSLPFTSSNFYKIAGNYRFNCNLNRSAWGFSMYMIVHRNYLRTAGNLLWFGSIIFFLLAFELPRVQNFLQLKSVEMISELVKIDWDFPTWPVCNNFILKTHDNAIISVSKCSKMETWS